MESKPKIEVNTKKIQDFVKNELLKEQKYQRENDAKFRAIEQRVPTFEDFRQMVLAAHLKPLDKGETIEGNVSRNNASRIWNSAISGIQNNADSESTSNQFKDGNDVSSLFKSAPSNSAEFIKTWKFIESQLPDPVSGHQLKWEYLQCLGADKLLDLFKAEINGDILGGFLLTFDQMLRANADTNKHLIYQFLEAFTKCNRFGLNLMFLKKEQTEACKSIFNLLEEDSINVVDLKKKYF